MQSITITFTLAQLAVISKGLSLTPYGEAAPVVNYINAQIQTSFDQQKDAADEAAREEKK
ncbi:hypothetical protein [Burkholderia orbicola]|uniref:hypothetical protein n=1 Tax=Burkholderia orbicola TaxID=2978683 RepID=UPI00264E0629|nr:hypothetical protein [Burkholderia orbicola]MDN7558232.1 hypothetical protein [Burkholderia orbicola]